MVFDWSGLALDRFECKTRKGKKLYKVMWTFKIYLGAREGILKIKAEIDDKEVGIAEFDFGKLESGIPELGFDFSSGSE